MSLTRIRAVLYRELSKSGEYWVVQGVEVDICTQARTAEAACYDFVCMLNTHETFSQAHGLQPFENIPPAPARFAELFEDTSRLRVEPGQQLGSLLPPLEMRLCA